jgi:hypothetical protein
MAEKLVVGERVMPISCADIDALLGAQCSDKQPCRLLNMQFDESNPNMLFYYVGGWC